MTLEQKDALIQAYCEVIGDTGDELCADCRIEHLCRPITGDFDRHPDVLEKAYEIISNTRDNGCEQCKFEDCGIRDYPCTECKSNKTHGDPDYATTPCLWTPKTPKLPIIETVPASTFNNPVNHPSHYNQGGIECIDAMVSAFGKEATATFCHLNAFKYLWRTEHKNGLQDVDKAIWYLNKFKELKASGE